MNVPALGRITAHLRRADEAAVDDVATRHGKALLTPTLPLVWQLNAVRVEDPDAGPGELAAEAEEVLGSAGHRKLVVQDPSHGARLAPALAADGWNVYRLLVMVRRRPPDRQPLPGSGAEVHRSAGAAVLSAFRREQPAHHRVVPVGEFDHEPRPEGAQPPEQLRERHVAPDRQVVDEREAEH